MTYSRKYKFISLSYVYLFNGGGVNVFSDAIPLVPYVNIESVVAADPEVIIAGGSRKDEPKRFESWQQWSGISAVINKHIYLIPSDLMQRHSARILDGAALMCAHLDSARPND